MMGAPLLERAPHVLRQLRTRLRPQERDNLPDLDASLAATIDRLTGQLVFENAGIHLAPLGKEIQFCQDARGVGPMARI